MDQQGTNRARKNIPGQIRNWSVQWGWTDRCKAWDAEVDRLAREAYVDEVKKMARIQAQEARACAAAAMAFVGGFLRHLQDPEERDRFDSIPVEELGAAALEAVRRIPAIHEAERSARCIRSRDMLADDGTVTTEWEIFERRPPREDPDLKVLGADEPEQI